jgi:hypothetical protein
MLYLRRIGYGRDNAVEYRAVSLGTFWSTPKKVIIEDKQEMGLPPVFESRRMRIPLL